MSDPQSKHKSVTNRPAKYHEQGGGQESSRGAGVQKVQKINISGVAVQHIRFPCYNLIARAGRVGSVTSVNTMWLPLPMAV